MLKIYYLKKSFYDNLVKDKEFCKDLKRPYYIIADLKYKNNKISIAIPLRSNINKNFQKDKNAYFKVPPSKHTLINKGFVAGWHILKMIPIKFEYVYRAKVNSKTLVVAISMININKKCFKKKCKIMLKRFENKDKLFGAVSFDEILSFLRK